MLAQQPRGQRDYRKPVRVRAAGRFVVGHLVGGGGQPPFGVGADLAQGGAQLLQGAVVGEGHLHQGLECGARPRSTSFFGSS
ncbi:hypothetical protein SMC26_16610 [Actinomadura fulvescens]